MKGFVSQSMIVLAALDITACAQGNNANTSEGRSEVVYDRGVSVAASRADNSGYARILAQHSKTVWVDGIETKIPEDGTITLTNGTHRIQCAPHDTVITVNYQPRTAPAIADCRAPQPERHP
jgi:hypothetical protein